MAPVVPDPKKRKTFRTAAAFESWLRRNPARANDVWLRIYKKDSGVPSITIAEALDVVLCWGWIDGIRKGLDDKSFLQRYVPRGRKSVWSKVNQQNVARLIAEGRMTKYGLAQVDAAKADGRWDRAYGMTTTEVPELMAAIEAEPKALAMYKTLTSQNRFALTFRVHNLKTEASRKKKIETFVEMLKRGETIYPQKAKAE